VRERKRRERGERMDKDSKRGEVREIKRGVREGEVIEIKRGVR